MFNGQKTKQKKTYIGHLMYQLWTTKPEEKSIYHTKSLKTNEMGGHPKHLHANTPHRSATSRKVLPVVLFVLGYSVRQTKRQHFPVFIRAPC